MRKHRLVRRGDPRLGALVEKLEAELADVRARLRDALDLRAAFEAIVKRELRAVPPMPPELPNPPVREASDYAAILDVSDVHVGELVRAEEVGGINRYDMQECRQRAGQLVAHAAAALELWRPAVLHVHLLGDVITGERIYRGQQWNIDAPLIRQVIEAAELLAALIVRLAERVPLLRVYAVAGNHGRAGKPGEYDPRTNFDTFVYILLAQRLQGLEVYISDASWLAYVHPETGLRHLLLHGDGIRSSLSIPYYGLDRAAREWGRTLGQAPHYVHVGHHHRAAEIQLPGGETLANGSWVGATAYGLHRYREAMDPEQRLHVFDPRGLVATHRLRLAERARLQPGAAGVLEVAR